MSPTILPTLLGLAVLLPLASFWVILLFARQLGKAAAVVAMGAIGFAALLSFTALVCVWLPNGDHWTEPHEEHAAVPAETATSPTLFVALNTAAEDKPAADAHAQDHGHSHDEHDHGHHHQKPPVYYSGEYYVLGQFGKLRLSISYYIDALTIAMFCMVTLIATLIHCYAMGYMHDELHDITDHEVTTSDGHHLHRPGRFPRFFQYLSLFCFSMLGLVLAGNIAMVFVFWELVGVCYYFLIGFYIERIFHDYLGVLKADLPALRDELFGRFGDPGTFAIFDGGLEMLDGWRARGLKIGIVSNWSARLPQLLERLGIAQRVDFVLC
jgi:NADH-quinone oxidoreductase subunit L